MKYLPFEDMPDLLKKINLINIVVEAQHQEYRKFLEANNIQYHKLDASNSLPSGVAIDCDHLNNEQRGILFSRKQDFTLIETALIELGVFDQEKEYP